MTENLKPCAYCQSPLELYYMDYEPYALGGRWFVECTNLGCPTHCNDEDKGVVVKSWNTRYQPRCGDCLHYNSKYSDCDHLPVSGYDYDIELYEDFYCAEFLRCLK